MHEPKSLNYKAMLYTIIQLKSTIHNTHYTHVFIYCIEL